MKRDEVIENLCETVALVYHSVGDFSEPSDGLCKKCFALGWREPHFQHSGKTLRFVRDAVVEKLKRDGFKIDDGFDSETGDPKAVAFFKKL